TVDCAPAVRVFLEKSGALGVTTTAGKGVIPASHPQSLGSALLTKPMQDYLASADVVIAAGTELAETDSWVDRLNVPGKIIRIDLDAFTLTRDYPPAVGILADAGEALTALTGLIKSGRKPDLAGAAAIRDAIRANLTPLERKHVKVLGALRDALPKDGIVVTDMTQIAYTANYNFPCDEPRCYFHPCGFGTLGYAMPAAIGAKIACPDDDVVCLAGDGSLIMNCQELATCVSQDIPVKVFLMNNGYMGMVRQWQELFWDRRYSSVEMGPSPDWVKLAEAFGATGLRCEDSGELEGTMAKALEADGPVLVDVRVSPEENCFPMIPAGAAARDMVG
ncbi:MAG TPA: thiamine pyrophosphate-binding protein, partial [Solirubrobacterales bacterium]|nr:thiamine pyrophosphate-binding protein [Solirubrobacterales bacterium]